MICYRGTRCSLKQPCHVTIPTLRVREHDGLRSTTNSGIGLDPRGHLVFSTSHERDSIAPLASI